MIRLNMIRLIKISLIMIRVIMIVLSLDRLPDLFFWTVFWSGVLMDYQSLLKITNLAT